MTTADQIRTMSNPYREAVARFAYREVNRDESTVTMYFEDRSYLTFYVEHVLK